MTEHTCPYCDRREPTEHLLALHVGEEHWERATEAERERFRSAYEMESEDLWRFRLTAIGVLVLLYFGFLFLYAVVG
ncbi:MAG: C2H2-type zinc finger protein [Halanaeroarchaeum sp.]